MEAYTRLNLRLFYWHLQIDDCWNCYWSYNSYHKDNKLKNGWIRLYTFNLFMKQPKCGCSRDQIKTNISKPNIEKIKSLSKEYKKIEKEIKQNEKEKDTPTLFSPIVTRKSLGNRNKQQMRNDLLQVYNQLQDIKNDSALNDKYRQNLKITKYYLLRGSETAVRIFPINISTKLYQKPKP